MPLPRIWKALRWAVTHPSADELVARYFGIEDPDAPRSRDVGSLDDLTEFGRRTGLGG